MNTDFLATASTSIPMPKMEATLFIAHHHDPTGCGSPDIDIDLIAVFTDETSALRYANTMSRETPFVVTPIKPGQTIGDALWGK